MQDGFERLQCHFEASEYHLDEEVACWRGLAEAANSRASVAKATQQRVQVDLAMK